MPPTKTTDPQALEQVRTMWQETGSEVLTMDAHLHDKILGAVSHLPHVAAFALMNALAEIRDQQIPSLDLENHSGGGLRDTTRIAASSPEMWRDIFLWNCDNVVTLIDAYARSLTQLKQLIPVGYSADVELALEPARHAR